MLDEFSQPENSMKSEVAANPFVAPSIIIYVIHCHGSQCFNFKNKKLVYVRFIGTPLYCAKKEKKIQWLNGCHPMQIGFQPLFRTARPSKTLRD
jgi:hypothetical protein